MGSCKLHPELVNHQPKVVFSWIHRPRFHYELVPYLSNGRGGTTHMTTLKLAHNHLAASHPDHNRQEPCPNAEMHLTQQINQLSTQPLTHCFLINKNRGPCEYNTSCKYQHISSHCFGLHPMLSCPTKSTCRVELCCSSTLS